MYAEKGEGFVEAQNKEDSLSGFFKWFEDTKNKLLNTDINKKLLPDAYPPPYGKPYTVVISDEVLLTQEYHPLAGGMLTKKRPGVEYFLASVAQDYELVIFSLQPMNTWLPTIEKVDPNHHAPFRLFLDSTVIRNGRQKKDLSLMNRPMDKIILVDVDAENCVQPENTIVVPKYDGDLKDTTLLDLLPFFKLVSMAKPESLKKVVKLYQEHGSPYFKAKYEEALNKLRQMKESQKQEKEANAQLQAKRRDRKSVV